MENNIDKIYKEAIKQLISENEKLNKRIAYLENKLEKRSIRYLSDNVVEIELSSKSDYDLFDFLKMIMR